MNDLYPWQCEKDFGHSDDKIAMTLHDCHGDMTATAKILGIRRSSLKDRIDKSPMLQEVKAELDEAIKDVAESNIRKSVLAGNIRDSKFILTTIGKDRGYVTRVETTGKDGKDHSAGMASEIGNTLERIAARLDAAPPTEENS